MFVLYGVYFIICDLLYLLNCLNVKNDDFILCYIINNYDFVDLVDFYYMYIYKIYLRLL